MRGAAPLMLTLFFAIGPMACAPQKMDVEPESSEIEEYSGSGGATEAAPAPVQSPAAAPPPYQGAGWQTTALGGSGPVAVKEGAAPLIYLVEAGGAFRVHDQTDRRDLARARAPGRTVIRVDARKGVVFGGETLLAGPLPADHRYAIYLDATGPNFSRQGTFQPRPGRKMQNAE